MRELSGDRPYSNLIASWGKKGRNLSATLATATYYTLHTMKCGQEIAHDIDRKLFGGATFLEKHWCSVPGGYSEPSEQDDETSTELSDLLVDFQWRGFKIPPPIPSENWKVVKTVSTFKACLSGLYTHTHL